MPYADPEVRKQKDREYKKRPEVMARNRELYRKRYADNKNGIRDKKHLDHYTRWDNPDYRQKKRDAYRRRWEEDWAGQKIVQLRAKAKKYGIDFNIDASDIPLPKKCPIFGIPLVVGREGGRNSSPSVDRIDNSKGYVKGNVVVISTKANAMKREASLNDLRKIVKFYENINGELQ